MKNPVKLSIATAFAGALLVAPGLAQEIIVAPNQSVVDRFIEDVSHDLDDELGNVLIDTFRLHGGIAKIRFQTDANGKPENVWFYEKSGDRQVNRIAMRAIKRLDGIDLESIGYPQDTVIHANVVISSTPGQAERLMEDLALSEAARLAAAKPDERRVLALAVNR